MILFLILFLFSQVTQIQMSLVDNAIHLNGYISSYRFYDPKVGHFLKADTVVPTAESKGLNRFAAFNNNPIRFNDPDGHVPQDPSNRRSQRVRSITHEQERRMRTQKALEDLGYTGGSGDQGESEKWYEYDRKGSITERTVSRAMNVSTGNRIVQTFLYALRERPRWMVSNLDFYGGLTDSVIKLEDGQALLGADRFRRLGGVYLGIDDVSDLVYVKDIAQHDELADMMKQWPFSSSGMTMQESYEFGQRAGRAQLPVLVNQDGFAASPQFDSFRKGYFDKTPIGLTVFSGYFNFSAGYLIMEERPFLSGILMGAGISEMYAGMELWRHSHAFSQGASLGKSLSGMAVARTAAGVAGRVNIYLTAAQAYFWGFKRFSNRPEVKQEIEEMGIYGAAAGVLP